ncbi:glycosyltransferase family 4 protein [Candidatus Nitrosopelagicus sp.]|nr:glycosyltransferase family 4 protein [Candidatus Nitrosopelagicus sp.]
MKILFAVDKTRFFYIKQFIDELEKNNVTCKIIDDLDIYDNSKFGKKYLRWIKTPNKFQNMIKSFDPDFIFTERVSHFSSLVLKTKIPLIIFLRGNFWQEVELGKQTIEKSTLSHLEINIKNKFAHKCFSEAHLILPICSYLKKIADDKYSQNKIHVLYQGIRQSDWHVEKGFEFKHPSVGFLQNTNIWNKTKEMLLLPKIIEQCPNVNFYWAGDGPFTKNILPHLEKFPNFHWLGSLEYPNQVRQFLSEIDIYGLITGNDMSPHTILEASLMKKPIIATDVGGISESIIEKETGFLIKEGDSSSWISKISFLIDNPNESKQIGLRGCEFVNENFSWKKIAKDFLKIIKI